MNRTELATRELASAGGRPALPQRVRGGVALRHWLLGCLNSVAIPILARAGGSNFCGQAAELERASRRPLAERQRRQLAALNALLTVALQEVPVYRERFADLVPEHGFSSLAELASLPVTRKSDLMAGFPDLVTREGEDRGTWQYVSTSGTVGRVVTVQDFARRDAGRAAALHAFREGLRYKFGYPILQIPPNICNVICGEGATNEHESFRRELWKFVKTKVRGGVAHMSDIKGAFERRVAYRTRMLSPLAPNGTDVPEADLEAMWDRIRAERPYLLHALPEYLLLLSDWALAEGRPPIVGNFILPMGGLASPAMRRRIVSGLGGTFLDLYGTAELGPIGFESSPGEGVRLMEELFIVEITHDDGTPSEEGEIGRVLITDLTNTAMPFIRYEVGDSGYWTAGPAGSSDSARRLHLVGRMDEVLRGKDDASVDPRQIRDALIERAGCLLFKLVEKRGGKIVLDYIPQRGADVSDDQVRGVLQDLLGLDRTYRVRRVRSIPAEASGKFRLIRREQTPV